MTLPNSSYEELLDQVRQLTHETMLLQEHLSSNCNPSDVNHNLSLVQKNYEKGIELADSVIRQCEQNNQQDRCSSNGDTGAGSHTSSSSDLTNIQRPWSRMSEGSNIGAKIPPGDLQSRLIAWRDKNRHILPLDKGGGGVSVHERRRPVSLHGPREEILFGSAIAGGCTWRPASHLLGRAQSAEPTTRHQEQPEVPFRKTEEHRISDVSIPETYAKSRHSYELDGNSTEDDTCQNSTLLSQKIPKSREAWPMKSTDTWSPSHSAGKSAEQINTAVNNDPMAALNLGTGMHGQRRLGAKLDVVYSLLSMLGSTEGREDMSATLLSMSNSVESCEVMRQSGCLPLIVQLIHAPGQDPETRERASRALYNIVHARSDEKSSRREARVLRFLEQLRDYCQALRLSLETRQPLDDTERHPSATIAALMKLSFDESHRFAMCQLGGLHSVAELVEVDHAAHGTESTDSNCVTLRRYSGMALTNLTFGDSNNKALLCSFREFMKALVSQLGSPSDDLRQVTASVLRNLSWRADSSSKQTLREVGAVVALMRAAMEGRKESTLKSILSALWNLSAHCSTNKMDICGVEGALAFLVDMLSFNAPSKTLAIVENAGGILRNVSSHIAVRDDYRAIVRERGCLQVLLRQLRSPSLTVVSNACGALWNLSARCPQDQLMLWDLGAVPMLRSLVHSKHKMISMGSSAALKNLLSARPNGSNIVHLDSTARGLGLPTLPSLVARRQKALEQEIDQNLSETCDNIEPSTSPINKDNKFSFKLDQSFLQSRVSAPKLGFPRSESRESMRSVTSTQSDTIFEKVNRNAPPSDLQLQQQSMHSSVNFNPGGYGSTSDAKGSTSEKKYTLRYMNAIPERLKPGEPLPDFRGLKCTDSTISWATTPPTQEPKIEETYVKQTKPIVLASGVNYDLHLKNMNKMASPIQDRMIDFSDLKYSSDDDKQSSAYFTGTEQEHSGSLKNDSSRTSSISDLNEGGSKQRMSFLKSNSGVKLDLAKGNLRADSIRSVTTSESTLTAEISMETDSAIFDEDSRKPSERTSGVPSLSSLEDEPNNLVRYATNASLNDIEAEEPKSLQDDDLSEVTYHTVQETYTIEDDVSQTQTLTYVSVDENTFKNESTDAVMHTANSGITSDSYESIERTDRELAEICNKTGVFQQNGDSNTVFSVNNEEILKSLQMQNEPSGHEEYRRQRDPDAMIASLDRLTATLVQQSEAMRERDLKTSLLSTDTWNEDTPNSVSFPSMSGSVPMVPSFKSDLEDNNSITEIAEDYLNSSVSMTDSRIIEREAIKLAEAVNQISLASSDLDAINPPSNMGSLVSLTASVGLVNDTVDNSGKEREPAQCPRKKSLPISGVVARRALGQNTGSRTTSLENLLNECNANNNSQLENVKPPSLMDELLNGGDMENSLLSVASITSEIDDCNNKNSDATNFDLVRPVANVMSMACLRYAQMQESGVSNSITECLDNINPPSLFNEVSRMDCNSDTLCIDVDLENEDLTHFVFDERIEEIANDTDEAVTPISSECCSSVESTPKKRLHKNRPGHLTPKQKRQLVKERYKTYTIAAELVKKEEEEDRKRQINEAAAADAAAAKTGTFSKLTPKQRRQEDRSRFQTQVLGATPPAKPEVNEEVEVKTPTTQIPQRTGIPMFRKFGAKTPTTTPAKVSKNHQVEQDSDNKYLTMTLCSKVASEEQINRVPSPESFANGVAARLSSILPQNDHTSEEEEESGSDTDCEELKTKGRPRIVKPGSRDSSTESNGPESEVPKGIRGRRKPLYSSSKAANLKNSTPQCSPAKQPAVNRSNSSPVVRGTRATTLRQHNSLQKTGGSVTPEKRVQSANKRSAIPQKSFGFGGGRKSGDTTPKLESPVKPLERQNTFTKDEPEMENTVVLPATPAKGKFTKGATSAKTSPVHSKLKTPTKTTPRESSSNLIQPKLVKTSSAEKISTTGIPTMAKRSITNLSSQESGIPRKISLGQRSNSNSSITSTASSNQGATRNKTAVKDATSKIASLWKKVEESKKSQQKQPDPRQWILPKSSTFEGVAKDGAKLTTAM